ncbi:MAG: DciA family protein [Candidatus Omnitrophota bacterium]
MKQIKDLIQDVIGQISVRASKSCYLSPEEWLKKTLTRKELGHIKFYYFRSGVLGVKVDSSVWKHNFLLRKEDLLQRIQRCAPEVRSLHFIVGDVR